MPEFYGYVRKI